MGAGGAGGVSLMGPSSKDRYVHVCVSGAECEKRW